MHFYPIVGERWQSLSLNLANGCEASSHDIEHRKRYRQNDLLQASSLLVLSSVLPLNGQQFHYFRERMPVKVRFKLRSIHSAHKVLSVCFHKRCLHGSHEPSHLLMNLLLMKPRALMDTLSLDGIASTSKNDIRASRRCSRYELLLILPLKDRKDRNGSLPLRVFLSGDFGYTLYAFSGNTRNKVMTVGD